MVETFYVCRYSDGGFVAEWGSEADLAGELTERPGFLASGVVRWYHKYDAQDFARNCGDIQTKVYMVELDWIELPNGDLSARAHATKV